MITRISDYNFDITNFDLFKRANNNVPKELATIINAIASTFFLSLDSLHLKVLSLPFLLNAQSIHQKRNVSLSQKNAQVILKTALCVIVGIVANKAKALIIAPLGIYLISKKLHFEYSSSTPSPRPQVSISSTIPKQEQTGTTDSSPLSPCDSSVHSSPLSSEYPSGDERDLSSESVTQQPSPSEDQVQLCFGIDPSLRSESSIGNQAPLQLVSSMNAEAQEFKVASDVTTLSLSKTCAVSVGRPRPMGIWKPSPRKERQSPSHFQAQGGGEGAEAGQEAKAPQQPSKKNRNRRKNKQTSVNAAP